jgi:hypothetical protein
MRERASAPDLEELELGTIMKTMDDE